MLGQNGWNTLMSNLKLQSYILRRKHRGKFHDLGLGTCLPFCCWSLQSEKHNEWKKKSRQIRPHKIKSILHNKVGC